MKPARLQRFKEVIRQRQPTLSVVLENVHDQHNIGAIMRTSDSVGLIELYILQTQAALQFKNLTLGKRTSAGTRRWLDVHYFTDRDKCFDILKNKYKRVLATHLSSDAQSLYELDLTQPTALLFGNEHDGITPETLELCDGNFIIPQVGMVRSLNISVAGAVTLYEAYRQRAAAGFYDKHPQLSEAAQAEMLAIFIQRHASKAKQKHVPKYGEDR